MTIKPQKSVKTANKPQVTNLRAVLTKYIYHWPLFILGLLIAGAGAYFYMHIINPVYEVSATILVKDDKKSPEDKPVVPELEQTTSPKNAEAEIEILRSKNLVSKVVNQLQLWTTYTLDQSIRTEDLYESAPFKFEMVQKGDLTRSQQLKVRIKDKNSFEVENQGGHKQTVAFNTPVKSTFGIWMLKPTDFLDQYVGSKITIGVTDPELVSNNYIKSLDVHLLDKLAPTIGIFTEDEVPKRGKDFLNNLIKAYNDASIAEEKRKTKGTIDFIDRRLDSLSGQLSHSESQVQGYRASQGLADLSSQTKAYLESVNAGEQKLNDVNVQLNAVNTIEQYVNSNADNPPATIGISDPTLTNLVDKLSQLQLKKTALLATTPENNPMFDPINKQIASTKGAIREAVKGIKASLLSQKSQIKSFNGRYQASINNVPIQDRKFGDMKRQQDIKENLYTYLLQKREELSLAYASNFPDARIVDRANVGDIKWPRLQLVAAIALIIGLGIPFLIIYFRESFGNRITSRKDIDALDIPILGEISYEDIGRNQIVVLDKNFLISEQFRALRTNLNFVHQNRAPHPAGLQLNLQKGMVIGNVLAEQHVTEGKGRVTIFTSSVSKEGKSFVSANIASSLAVSGRKTVILEMDLRKPKVSKMFGLAYDHPGISDYLSYNIPLDSIIQPSGLVPNLDVLSCGPIPSDPSELLEKDRYIELITELKERYDDVIIDTPPLHLVTDAMIIARAADVSIYVVRQGYTGKDELEFLHEIYGDDRLPNMNIIFNGIKRNKYGYGYRYDNSYYSESRHKRTFGQSMKHFFSRF